MLGSDILGSSLWGSSTEVQTVASTSLSTPQLMDFLRLHHPNLTYKITTEMLTFAQLNFVRETKLLPAVSTINMASQSLVGTTKVAPLSIVDNTSTYTWQFYKDTTVGTITMLVNTNVMFFTDIFAIDPTGNPSSKYTVRFNTDGSLELYDQNGSAIEVFDGDVTYMRFEFTKIPADLVAASTSIPSIKVEYYEALVDYVLSELYMQGKDLPTIEKLQMSKHYMNLYERHVLRAKQDFKMKNNIIPISMQAEENFARD